MSAVKSGTSMPAARENVSEGSSAKSEAAMNAAERPRSRARARAASSQAPAIPNRSARTLAPSTTGVTPAPRSTACTAPSSAAHSGLVIPASGTPAL